MKKNHFKCVDCWFHYPKEEAFLHKVFSWSRNENHQLVNPVDTGKKEKVCQSCHNKREEYIKTAKLVREALDNPEKNDGLMQYLAEKSHR